MELEASIFVGTFLLQDWKCVSSTNRLKGFILHELAN